MQNDAKFPIPAATLVIFRVHERQTQHLFVERSGKMAFAPGAVVFPGGRVDPGDYLLAEGLGLPDRDDAAARVAAIRETIEEAGVGVGLTPEVGAETIAQIRAGLAAGQDFADLLSEAGLVLNLEALVPFARWLPRHRETRIFDTRFYLAELRDDSAIPTVDDTENVHLFWASAQDVLDRTDAGKMHIIFPTRRNLERLAMFADFIAARTHADSIAIEPVESWVETREGEDWICIPDRHGYPVTAERLKTARRG